MRIAYVFTQSYGGPIDVAVQLAATLSSSGEHQVRVFGPRPDKDAELVDGMLTEAVMESKTDLRGARSVRSELRAWCPDVVHSHDRRAGLLVTGLHRTKNGPKAVVHTHHGVPTDISEEWFRGMPDALSPSSKTRATLVAESMIFRGMSRVVVPSSAVREFLIERQRVPADRVVQINNGVQLPERPIPPPGPVRKLIFVGVLARRKGLFDLLEAFGAPGVTPPDATLTVVGSGPEADEATAVVKAMDLADRVKFLGFRTDVADLLADHDALVLPSWREQQPVVIAEAMALAKPVLASDTGGIAEMLAVDGASKYLSKPRDVRSLMEKLMMLFADPDPGALGLKLSEHSQKVFAAGVCADLHVDLYARALS